MPTKKSYEIKIINKVYKEIIDQVLFKITLTLQILTSKAPNGLVDEEGTLIESSWPWIVGPVEAC